MDLKDWNDLKGTFVNADILLGNGFSIKLHSKFNYNSLFEKLLEVTPNYSHEFLRFNTVNFERILLELNNTKKVNDIFGIECDQIERAIEQLRNGLVRTVQENHPIKDEIDWDRLRDIASQLTPFNDIYTLNYDAILYHIILIIKDMYDARECQRPYNDYFWEEANAEYLRFKNFQNIQIYKHVYYLHGALFIFRPKYEDLKVRRGGQICELLEIITRKIQNGVFPLFVSEGNAEDKKDAIGRSNYLTFANDKLSNSKRNLVIYGASLSDADRHILDSINRYNREIAVSIHTANKTPEEIADTAQTYTTKFSRAQVVHFFDSDTLFLS